jgi:prepilin-type N-terminal cleavage/methylation domain-containing protein
MIKNQKGFSLLEVILAIAIMGIVSVAFLGGLSNASKSLAFTNQRQRAKTFAEHQLEYVRSLTYHAPLVGGYDYPPDTSISSEYPDYTATIKAYPISSRDNNIEKIIVVVSFKGTPVLLTGNSTVEGYKVY